MFGLHQAEGQKFPKICSDHHQGPSPIIRGPLTVSSTATAPPHLIAYSLHSAYPIHIWEYPAGTNHEVKIVRAVCTSGKPKILDLA